MKKSNLLLGMLALALVFGMTFVGCKNDGFNPGAKLGEVPELEDLGSDYADYIPISKEEASAIYENVIEPALNSQLDNLGDMLPDDLLPFISIKALSNIKALPSRKSVSASLDIPDISKYLKDEGYDMPEGIKITGKVNAFYSADDVNVIPLIVRGNASFGVELTNPIQEDEVTVMGKIGGTANVNINVTEASYAGYANFSYYCAFLIAIDNDAFPKKYVRCVANVWTSVDISKNTATVSATSYIYGEGNNVLYQSKPYTHSENLDLY